MNGRSHLFWVSQESCPKVKTERKLVIGHRLEVHERVIFGALPWRLDRKLGVAPWVKACIATHRFFEALLVPGQNVLRVIQRNETRVALLQVERFDKAMEPKPVDRVFTGEHRPQCVQDIAIGAETSFNDAVCVFCLALKPQSRYVLDRIPGKNEQEKRARDP